MRAFRQLQLNNFSKIIAQSDYNFNGYCFKFKMMYNFSMRIINFKIDEKSAGMQIRDYLRGFGVSSALLTKLKQTENGITKNGVFAKAIEKIECGDELAIRIENEGKMPVPADLPLNIVFEDEDILAINKPPFMPVHESRNHRGDALSNAVANYMKDKGDFAFRAVFRLDRDTSGIVLTAKNELAAAKLAGKIKKDYYAVVCGEITGGGIIDAPIRRLGDSIIKRGVFDDGVPATTHYESIKTNGKYTLLKINLETGRTHQIRVHFSNIGHPLAGDDLYGGSCADIARQALHCKVIYFTHPVTGEEITLECDFPPDIKTLIEEMK